jgi:hypothetical protein
MLKKLIEGLPIKFKSSSNVEVLGENWTPKHIEDYLGLPFTYSREVLAELGWRVILALMDEYEEPKTTYHDELINQTYWESGTVFSTEMGLVRIDKFVECIPNCREKWEAENFNLGRVETIILPNEKIYRLPHQFEVGDWFECWKCSKEKWPQQVRIIVNELLYPYNGGWHSIWDCRHVPAPKKPDLSMTSC